MTQVDMTPPATTTATPAITAITKNGQDLDRCVIRPCVPDSAVQFPPSIPLGRHLFERLRAQDPESLFLVHAEDPDRRCLTYGELFQRALGLSHGLVDKFGLRNGDRLAVLSPNHEHYFIADFACLFAGIAVASLNAHTTAPETARLLMETQPHAMIVHSSLYQTARDAIDLAKLAHEPRVILLDAPTTPQLAAITKNVPQMHGLIVPGQAELPSTIAQVQLDDTVYLMFTSGTTGNTKAVQMTHRMLRTTMMEVTALKPASTAPRMRWDGTMGFFHGSGKFSCINAALVGASIYFFDHFTTGGWLNAVERFQITASLMSPRNLVALMKDPRTKERNLSSLKYIITVSAPLSKTTQVLATELFKVGVLQSYGSTEALSIALPYFGGSSPLRPGVIGWLKPGNEALLLNLTTQKPIPINPNGVTGPGELVVRGPCVMSNTTGYFNRPKETKAAFIWIDGRPWYRMGDIIQIDADGCMTFLDRIHDKFARMGNQVVTSEVEAQILTVDGVLDAVVVPIRRVGSMEEDDPLPCAAVVPRSMAVFTDAKAKQELTMQIVTAVAKTLPSHYHLDGGVVYIEAVPRNQTGKILRRDARKLVVDMLKGLGKAE